MKRLPMEKYRKGNPDGYCYSHFCQIYARWKGQLSPVMRQHHPAGERLFVDYAGMTVDVTDPETGEVRAAQVFIATMGASSYSYVEATWAQKVPGLDRKSCACLQLLRGYHRTGDAR